MHVCMSECRLNSLGRFSDKSGEAYGMRVTEPLSGKGNLTYGLHHGSHSGSTVM
jgi:hypothetical protein